MQRSKKLFDHLVGERKQLRWNFESERLGGLEVGDEFEFGGPDDRQVGVVRNPNNPAVTMALRETEDAGPPLLQCTGLTCYT